MQTRLSLELALVLAGVLVCSLHASTDCNSREAGGTCHSMAIEKVFLGQKGGTQSYNAPTDVVHTSSHKDYTCNPQNFSVSVFPSNYRKDLFSMLVQWDRSLIETGVVGYEVLVRKKATGMLLSRASIDDQGVSSVLLEKVTRYSVATSLVVQVKIIHDINADAQDCLTMEINMQDAPKCHSFVYNQRCSQRMPYSLISSSLIAAETVPLSSPGPLQHIQLHLSWPSHVGHSVVITLTHPGQNTTNCTLPGRDPPCFIASNTTSVTIGPLNASTQYKAHLHSFNPSACSNPDLGHLFNGCGNKCCNESVPLPPPLTTMTVALDPSPHSSLNHVHPLPQATHDIVELTLSSSLPQVSTSSNPLQPTSTLSPSSLHIMPQATHDTVKVDLSSSLPQVSSTSSNPLQPTLTSLNHVHPSPQASHVMRSLTVVVSTQLPVSRTAQGAVTASIIALSVVLAIILPVVTVIITILILTKTRRKKQKEHSVVHSSPDHVTITERITPSSLVVESPVKYSYPPEPYPPPSELWPSVLILYSPETPLDEKEEILRLLVAGLTQHAISAKSPDVTCIKEGISYWLEKEIKQSTVLCVCNKELKEEWDSDKPGQLIGALRQLIHGRVTNGLSDFATVLLQTQGDDDKRDYVPTDYLKGQRQFVVRDTNDIESIAHYILRVPLYTSLP